MLETRGLCKSFGGLQVTRDVSFRLEPGERRVILGPNGAGKTTLFNLLVGTLRATSGEILIDGRPAGALSVAQRARMGVSRSYQRNNLFEDLTVRENLMLAASAAQRKSHWMIRDSFRDREVRETVEEVAEQVALTAMLDAPVRSASYGNRRQLEHWLASRRPPPSEPDEARRA